MRIIVKLTLSFLVISLLVLVMGYFSSGASQKALEKTIGVHSAELADGLLDIIDRYIYDKLILVQRYGQNLDLRKTIINSNREFEKLDDIASYIDRIDTQWIDRDSKELAPFIQNLINNPLSQKLRRNFVGFRQEEYGYHLFSEVFATNKYGANCAQTQKTTDYMQADEEWWRMARKDGFYIADVAYDENAKVYSIDICVRVDDDAGNFLGIIKASLDVRGVIDILVELEKGEIKKYRNEQSIYKDYGDLLDMRFDLLTKDGRSIYSTMGNVFFKDLSGVLFIDNFKRSGYNHLYYDIGIDARHDKEGLFVYARSGGYRNFKGLGWILVIQHDTEKVFAASLRLRNILLITAFLVTVLAIFIGFFIARSISAPIMKLKDATVRISEGELDTNIDVASKDEVGELAASFNAMVLNIKNKQKQLIRANNEIESWSKTLEKRVEQRTEEVTKSQEETLEVMRHLQEAYAQLKKTHFQLIQSEKMKAIGTMASGIAHEVKNPLGIILQGVDYLDRVLSPMKNKEALETLRMIKDSVERADTIICTLLNFSRSQELKIKGEDINRIVANSLVLVQHRVKLKKIKLTKEFASDLPKVLADRSKMEQVFVNVLINACHAMPEGGELSLRTYQTKLKDSKTKLGSEGQNIFKSNETVVTVEIVDTGLGISKDKLKIIFDPFFTTKKAGEGTGLGLSIVKNIIDMHNASIEVKSKEGKGTKIIITFKVR